MIWTPATRNPLSYPAAFPPIYPEASKHHPSPPLALNNSPLAHDLPILCLKAVKAPVKASGCRLSSRAFELLNDFCSALLVHLASHSISETILDCDLLPDHGIVYLIPRDDGLDSYLNRMIHWLLQVTIHLLESKGQATMRRADLEAIMRRAPMLANVWHLIVPPKQGESSKDAGNQYSLDSGDDLVYPQENKLLPRQFLHDGQAAEEVDSVVVEKSLAADGILSPSTGPTHVSPVPCDLRRNHMIQIVSCADPWLPWCKTTILEPPLRVLMTESRGVETDGSAERSHLRSQLHGLIDQMIKL